LDNLNINAEIVEQYNKLGNEGLIHWKEWREIMQDEEQYKKLSPIEQQTLHENSRSFTQMLTELDNEVKYLINTKHTLAVTDCLNHILSANQLLDKLVEIYGGREGAFSFTKLKHVKQKGWEKVDYKNKIFNLATELDLLTDDFGAMLNHEEKMNFVQMTVDALMSQIYVSFVQSLAWLNSEYDRIEQQGMPEPGKFKLPEIQVPKVPEDGENEGPKEPTLKKV
jgi:predicted site-specific integrase-resolvase